MRPELIALSMVVLVGLMGLFMGLRPEQYARHFLPKWQREGLEGQFKSLSWTGWGIFAFSIVFALFLVFRIAIRPYDPYIEVGALLVFALAWLWWGLSLLLRPDTFARRAPGRVSPWVARLFGGVLLVGAVNFGYWFAVKFRALLR